EPFRNGGVLRNRFVMRTPSGGLLAAFGPWGHFEVEGAPCMQLVDASSSCDDALERCQDWTVVSASPVVNEIPEEVAQEAQRIAAAKARDLSSYRDGNDCAFVLPSDPLALRGALYKDHFEDSTRVVDAAATWTCAVCLRGSECDEVRRLDCGHCFHSECIKAWFRRGRCSVCPLGRCPVSKDIVAAVRAEMDFSLSAGGAWPLLPDNTLAQDTRSLAIGEERCHGRLPHDRGGTGWRRFRAEDFNPVVLVQIPAGGSVWDPGGRAAGRSSVV
ncbi:unnamed protein product, partial [Symbiodinium sp. KB8]